MDRGSQKWPTRGTPYPLPLTTYLLKKVHSVHFVSRDEFEMSSLLLGKFDYVKLDFPIDGGATELIYLDFFRRGKIVL